MGKIKNILIIILFFIPTLSYTLENPVWVESDGEAYMSEIDTPKEVMERAKRNAQSKALEKAIGVFIRSHTLVTNSQLAEDLIYASVRGKILKSQILKEGWDEKNRNLYKVNLRALVKPVYSEQRSEFIVKLALSKYELKDGDEVKIFYEANKDCYIYLFSIAADGSVTVLLPNSLKKENFARAGETYEFPPFESPIKLKAMLLPNFKYKVAEEKIKIIATKNKEDIIPLGFQEGMFKVYDAKSTGMISDLVRKLNQLEPTDWTEAVASYRIIKK